MTVGAPEDDKDDYNDGDGDGDPLSTDHIVPNSALASAACDEDNNEEGDDVDGAMDAIFAAQPRQRLLGTHNCGVDTTSLGRVDATMRTRGRRRRGAIVMTTKDRGRGEGAFVVIHFFCLPPSSPPHDNIPSWTL